MGASCVCAFCGSLNFEHMKYSSEENELCHLNYMSYVIFSKIRGKTKDCFEMKFRKIVLKTVYLQIHKNQRSGDQFFLSIETSIKHVFWSEKKGSPNSSRREI